ncbi:hypothetical protein Z517_04463 [Fonsecaea pedrosoi CBS 271.37]|uniref:Uncharacterized protein n=1 Tax=Fonsecaea pedrosoi CBS 271.37 TaxID=1442368 RepID=A0A0D2GKP6_9EURO|nr:uncharacterized protein Z517_04463 [Fonsecaea pedrosoi CBS 271.37]KIW81438.1 hypothetical protein Z517_04463 [Fonsecaea pedrosoi CBS 271.37]
MDLVARKTRLVIVNDGDHKKSKAWRIVIIVLSSISLLLTLVGIGLRIMIRRRARRAKAEGNNEGEDPSEEDPGLDNGSTQDPPKHKEHPYYNSPGYEATADQNQTLLGNDERPPTTRWDSDSNSATGIQRPESIASYYNVPPPRYE